VLTQCVFDTEKLSQSAVDQEVRRLSETGESLYRVDDELLLEASPDLIVTQDLCHVCAITPREVDRGDAIASIANALDKSGLAPAFLEIEVTERVLLDDVETAGASFRQIKDLGVRLCIDDFGTGYSSLSYLRNYPFDVLKIDRAFVYDATRHASGVSLLRAIIAMAESLELQVVAEGVENAEQFDLLCELGCGFAQGHYFCAPLSAARIGIGGPIVAVDLESGAAGEEPQGWLRALKVDDE